MKTRNIVLFMMMLLCIRLSADTEKDFHFQHINTKGYAVRVVYRDVNGVMWLGTTSGLLTLPQLTSRNPSSYHRTMSKVNMSIRNISGDGSGGLWIKTLYNNNYFYNPLRNEFVEDTSGMLLQKGVDVNSEFSVKAEAGDNTWIWKDNRIYWLPEGASKANMITVGADDQLCKICRDGKNLMALSQNALYIISPEKKQFEKRILLPSGYNIRDHLFVTGDHKAWVWSEGIAWRLDNGQWVKAFEAPSDISAIAQDGKQRIWISTHSNGIYVCDRQGGVITHLEHYPSDVYGLQSNRVEIISFEPVSQTMWVAYTKGGLSVFTDKDESLLLHRIGEKTDENVVTDVLTFAPAHGSSGMLIGLEGRGVFLHDKQGDRNVISGGSAVALYAQDDGTLWAGIYRKGLVRKSADGKEQLYFEGTSPFAMTSDEHGVIYAALLGMGVWQLNPANGETTDTHIFPPYVFDLEYRQHRLYAATTDGLYVRDEKQQWKLLNNGHFHYLNIDHQGYLWLMGNEGSEGLTLLTPEGRPVELPDNLKTAPLKSLAIDKQGNVWAITPSELLMLRYHPKAEKPLECYSFNINMEGQQVFYNTHISYVDDDGVLWLGATTGYQKIDTRQLIAKTKKTDGVRQLVLGSVSINDIVLSPGQTFNGRVLLDKDIIFVRELNLRYNENNIVVECSQPCGDSYSTDTYFYQLRGFSDAWRPFEGHTIILSNLPPGDYELYTRTQSSEAFLLLTIHIARPVWLSWWAISLYVLLLAAIVYGVVRYFMGKRAYQKKLVDLQQEQEQQSKMNELKLHFFTNISHDLRTPLSLIIGPVEEMMKTDGNNKQLEMVHRNAQHLLSLVNQILDFRRLEFGKEKLLLSYGDIVSLLGDIYNSFRLKAEKEKIQFRFQPSVERVETMFDRDKTTKIMMNLLSNAFKFTGTGESITVTLNISDGQIFISVEDTGVGISDSDKAHIFDRFYQSDEHNRSSMGSGIGLHIVREYVRLQGGEITVTDNPKGQGSVFRFNLPLKKNDEQETNGTWTTQGAKPEEQGQQDDVQGDVQDSGASDLPTLLLVDDHRDLLDYMSKSLSDSYQIQTANNGVEALRRLESSDVDLIVCDVMMPEMNGLELCQRVKADINTSHIPVVLLTAKAMTSDELKGLEAGADDYITKPFSMDILRQRIRNLMDRNRKQHERFAKEIDIKPSEITVTSLDEQFIANAISIVEAHIAEPDFSVEQLSDEIGVHRTQLYKKLLHLTGKTPLQFVRIIRLKRGKQLLKQSGMYVSEVAYQVGFNSPRVFSKYFKEEFGITPKEYQK